MEVNILVKITMKLSLNIRRDF